MEINYVLDSKGYIDSWSSIPFDPSLPCIEVENPYDEIILGYTKIIDGKLVTDTERYEHDRLVNEIRIRREVECFIIVNRGQLWYNTLTKAQKQELDEWYHAWLEAPETLIIPPRPSWIK